MTAYITVEFTPKNSDILQSYSAKAAETIAKFKGEFLVKAPLQALDGITNYQYKAIIGFPTKELAENWYHSPGYQSLISLRNEGMDSSFALVG